jgi:hypothetical protein
MSVRIKTFIMLAALGLIVACSSNSGPPDAGTDAGTTALLPSPPLAPITACNQISQALAGLEVRCNRLAQVDSANWAAAYCAGWIATEQAEFDAGLLAYDPTAVNCEAAFRKGQACNLPDNSPSGCGTLAWGTLLTGDTCGDPYSCQEGDYCNRSAAGVACGNCYPDPQVGAACGPAVSNAPCLGSECNGFDCEPVTELAGQCGDESVVCSPGLSCNTAGICSTPAVEGTSCGQDSDCLDGLFCNANLLVCQIRPSVGAACPSSACAFGAVCVSPVFDGGPDDEDGGFLYDAGPGTCVEMIPLGPCVVGFCLEGEACDADGGCVVQPGLGQPCNETVGCLAGSCFGGICVSLPANQACSLPQQCQYNLCGGNGDFFVCAGACTGL